MTGVYFFGALKHWIPVVGAASIIAGSASAGVLIDDDFSDGDLVQTGPHDTKWWRSNISKPIEVSADGSGGYTLGLVSGRAGRGIHTTFKDTTLRIGDALTVTFTFKTPATVGANRSRSLRFGLFDRLGRDLGQAIVANYSSPSPLYGDKGAGGQAVGLPGYAGMIDVGTVHDDINLYTHDTASASGMLLAKPEAFINIANGPNEEYNFVPDAQYTGSISLTRVNATDIAITSTLDSAANGSTTVSTTHKAETFTFGFLGFHVGGLAFGSSSDPGTDDNGIDFSNITVQYTPAVDP